MAGAVGAGGNDDRVREWRDLVLRPGELAYQLKRRPRASHVGATALSRPRGDRQIEKSAHVSAVSAPIDQVAKVPSQGMREVFKYKSNEMHE